MTIISKKNLYLTLWAVLGMLTAILVMGAGSLVAYYIISFDPATMFAYREIVFSLGQAILLILLFVGLYIGIAFGQVAWDKIYVQGVRGKKYIVATKG